jgi:Protein of unknown function (DUF4240)
MGEERNQECGGMDDDTFWAVIEKTVEYEGEDERQMAALTNEFRGLTAAEIEGFERAFQRQQLRAYDWRLWGAAHVIHGGAGDDSFEYFQRWLISKGRDVFDAILADPDLLADVLPDEPEGPCEFEEFAYVASHAWQAKTGINPWEDEEGRFPYTGAPPADNPTGKKFKDTEAYLSKSYPKLWARFGNSPLG